MKRNPSSTTQALKLLMQDHRRIRKLVRRAHEVRGDAAAFADAVTRVCAEVAAHAAIEAKLFYPVLASASPRAHVADAEVEHDVIEVLAARLTHLPPDDERYLPTFRVLCRILERHIDDEEDDLFTRAAASRGDFSPLVDALLHRQRHGGLADVDLEVATEDACAPAADPRDPQRVREPGRRGAH